MTVQPIADVRRALDGVLTFFRERQTRPGLLARRLLGRPARDDAELTEHLIRERRRRTRINGSMDGSLMRTAWVAWEFLDLDCPADHAAVVRTIGYVLSQQDRPGHFAEGCDERRHAVRLCHHFLSGFFAAGTAAEAVAPLELPWGLLLGEERAARFAASCFALRTVLRAGEDRRGSVRKHLDALVELLGRWDELPDELTPDLRLLAFGALARAPIDYRSHVDEFASHIVARQEPGGGWTNVDLFHTLEMLLSVTTAPTREALRRAAPLLCTMQQSSGAFDPTESEEKTLIAARVLQLAA